MKKFLAIIPARAGSKRIPRKNVYPLAGIPLIEHTLKLTKDLQHIDQVVVNSDDEEVLELTKKYNHVLSIKRPLNLSSDTSKDTDYILHTLEVLKKSSKDEFENVIILRPTSPLRTLNTFNKAIQEFLSAKSDSLRTVTRVTPKNHPYWTYKSNELGYLTPFIDNLDTNKFYQSQLLPKCYSLNGLIDILKVSNLSSSTLYGNNIKMMVTSDIESIDIDDVSDIDYCEFIISKYHLLD